MANKLYKDYILEQAPPFLRGFWWDKFFGTLGNIMDYCHDSARDGILTSTTLYAVSGSLPFIGSTRNIESYPVDTDATYKARLSQSFTVWNEAGTEIGLKARLGDFGLTDMYFKPWITGSVVQQVGYENWFSVFWVGVSSSHGFKQTGFGDGGFGDNGFGTNVPPQYFIGLKNLVYKWGAANEICSYFSFLTGSNTVTNQFDWASNTNSGSFNYGPNNGNIIIELRHKREIL